MYRKIINKERLETIDFLKGLLIGITSIYDVVNVKPRYFMLSNEEGICYLADFNNHSKPILTNGKYKRFALEKLIEMRKRDPMSCIIVSFVEGARPPFPTLDEEAK